MIQWKLIFTALSMILFISVVHIITPVEKILLHISFRFLYLIPIALAGFKGGKKHGLIIALLSILAYLPHFFIQDMPESFQIENVLGMTIFCIVEILSGTYADLKRNSVIRKYDAVPLHPHQKRKETILFYVDDSPKSLNCPNWSAANHLNNHRCNLNILYGQAMQCLEKQPRIT